MQRIRSVPWRFVFMFLSPAYLPPIIVWCSFSKMPSGSMMIFMVLPLSALMIFIMPQYLREYRRKRVQYILSYHNCPHCGYSLIGIPRREHRLTACPECGTEWRLPEQITSHPTPHYRRDVIILGVFLLIISIFISGEIHRGEPLFSALNTVIIGFFIYLLYQTISQWVQYKRTKPHMYIPSHQEIQLGICPACNALIAENMTNSDSITTCPECGVVCKFPEESCPTKLSTGFYHSCGYSDESI